MSAFIWLKSWNLTSKTRSLSQITIFCSLLWFNRCRLLLRLYRYGILILSNVFAGIRVVLFVLCDLFVLHDLRVILLLFLLYKFRNNIFRMVLYIFIVHWSPKQSGQRSARRHRLLPDRPVNCTSKQGHKLGRRRSHMESGHKRFCMDKSGRSQLVVKSHLRHWWLGHNSAHCIKW